jgi:D-3-phosphoglycerate dehydrogenase
MRILVINRIHPDGLALLRSRAAVDVVESGDADEIRARISAADAVVLRTSPLRADAIACAPHLKVVSRHGVGYDNVDVAALTARRIPLAVVGPVNAVSVAEHAMFLLLAAAKRGVVNDRAVRSGDWDVRDALAAVELAGKTLVVVGFGRIGRAVAARAEAFGMRILAYDPILDPTAVDPTVELAQSLDEALAAADAVSLHLPFGPGTHNLIDAARLARMKPSAILVNTARGGLVDEAALADALRAGRLAAAGLDVFAEEPPAPDDPLIALDNVVLSPHAAALTTDCAIRMSMVAARNCLDGLDGRVDPALVVNPEVLE